MGTKERRDREKELLKREIMDAARELFVAEGYENVSMRKIANKIEYSPTTIYLYFKDKSELFFLITEETFSDLNKVFESIKKKHNDPVITVRELGRAYIHFGLKHPNDYRITFMTPLGLTSAEEPFEGSTGERAFNYLRDGVAECVKQKKFRKVDVDAASQSLWAAMHGVTSLLIASPNFPWVGREKLIDLLLNTMIDGLKKSGD